MMGGGLVFLLLLIGVVVAALGGIDGVKELLQQNRSGNTGAGFREPEPNLMPEEILRERYARGEISREEYLEAQETLKE